jgi:hypothetical protein
MEYMVQWVLCSLIFDAQHPASALLVLNNQWDVQVVGLPTAFGKTRAEDQMKGGKLSLKVQYSTYPRQAPPVSRLVQMTDATL